MLRLLFAALVALATTQVLQAQQGIPDKRLSYESNTDFVGTDLQQLFDTDLTSCRRACEASELCVGFTYNSRSKACFPKQTITGTASYDGAFSARLNTTTKADMERGEARAKELAFLKSYNLSDAYRQAENLGRKHPNSQWALEVLYSAAQERNQAGDYINAQRWTGVALAITDAPQDWLTYGQQSFQISAIAKQDKRANLRNAMLAGINSYLRSDNKSLQSDALLLIADTLEPLGQTSELVAVLKHALALDYRESTAAALASARAKYGFRVQGTVVESNSVTPRVCAEFTEDLSKSETDYSRFVALPDPRFAVEAEGRRLCITGVEHGQTYEMNFRAGLPAQSGEVLGQDVRQSFYIRDRAPEVRFPGRGYILPLGGEASLPVETVNLSELNLTLRRVSDRNLLRAMQDDLFAKPLYAYQERKLADQIGEDIWSGTGFVTDELNQNVTTRLPISEAIKDAPAGIYVLSARSAQGKGSRATQWFVISDLGISTASGAGGLHVFLRSLKTAKPLDGIKVTLLSKGNRVLGTAQTDANGSVHFSAALTAGQSSAEPALILANNGEDDMAFLSLTDPAFDLSDRGVSGRDAAGPIDLFATTERGAYRAGETVYATALARNGASEAVTGLPLTAVLLRPDGVEYSRQVLQPDTSGGYVAAFPVATSAPRGAWTLDFRSAERALASENFLVEDFLPERIDFDINLPEGALDPTQAVNTDVNAIYLFGAPAAGLKVAGRVSLRSSRTIDAFQGFSFGAYDAPTVRKSALLPAATTDDQGFAKLSVTLPEIDDVNTPMDARFEVQVAEGSGRPTERHESRRLLPAKPLIGIKPLFDHAVSEGSEAAFDVIAVGPELTPIKANARWTVNRVQTRYQWYEQYGRWRWDPIVTRSKVASGMLDMPAGKGSLSVPVNWGQFEVVVELEGGSYTLSSQDFSAGWYVSEGSVRTPDTLELSLDREAYSAGDEAKLRIVPRQAGEALVQVMNDSVISSRTVSLSEGENLIPLTVEKSWGAGAYVSVTHISPMGSAGTGESFLPTRAIGLAYAKVDPADKALAVEIQALEETQPRQPLNVRVKVAGVASGEQAYLTLAAVDAGILNLTGFEAPDPGKHYFGKRKLGVDLRDVYGRLIDASKGELGRLRSGGGASNELSAESVPPPEDLVTFFEGPVSVGSDGYADVSFDIPAFNGTLRLMAIAWSKTGVGSAKKDVIIRDPMVLTASLPRFLAPDDTSRMLLEVVHADGPTGEITLQAQSEGVLLDVSQLPATADLQSGKTLRFSVPVTAVDTGDHTITLSLQTPDGSTLTKQVLLPVRVLDPEISTTRRFSLAAGTSLTLDENLLQGFKQAEGRVAFTAGPIARFDVAELLTTLDRYPYGCTEQLTSAAMPLLYMSSVSDALGLSQSKNLKPRIESAISRILTRQSRNGSFGLWRPSSGDAWLTAYVTDFLTRARKAGYDVPDAAYNNALINLRNRVNNAPDFDEGGGDIAYALYVLAREGKAVVSDLRYYADVKSGAFSTPMGSAHLAAALAFYGDQPRADALFGRASALLERDANAKRYRWRSDYGTPARDRAAIIALASAAKSDAVDIDALSLALADQSDRRSTQEMVWTLLAVDALTNSDATSDISLDGVPMSGPPARTLTSGDLWVGKLLDNTSDKDTDVTLTTFGIPDVPPEAGGYGYAIERSYYTLEGTRIEALDVKAGERFAVHLRVKPFEQAAARLMINDPLPAGFEIDNPNLLGSGDIAALPWLKPTSVAHSEFRSDRFLAAVNARNGETIDLAYIVRAVTPGKYHHPAATVEDMYRPTYRANTDSGEVSVSE
ncbi:alpha-2-macroglobulin family protein [Lentibacter algarum]|uniref:alpha-2-macroglobulin family protein n=1 Tax=Lentibacter algarum TaxID=576131 RepID=UPI001C07C079|nr:alpha-2-macroglobulin family protein [Lentibacter algarum]MBU2981349.1 alpha-2-macroglobulin family protein [Lentibacter algarum]